MESILREFQTRSFISTIYSTNEHNYIVNFIKIRSKNLVNKANLCMHFIKNQLDYAYKCTIYS